jgi:hypothetical protein
LQYVRRLPDTSLTHAYRAGGWEHFGWGQDRHLWADIYDAMTFNTEATGHWSKRPNLPSWPRPTSTTERPKGEKKPRSVKELFFQVDRQKGG